jgi:AraC-like DNA-binding protein
VSDNTALAAQCFLEALSALNHRLVRGKGSVILFQDLPKADLIDSEELNALLGDFNRALGESRWDEARAAAEPVFAFCRRYSLSAARYILGRLLYRLNELHLIHGVPVHGMAEFDTTDRLIDFAKDLLAAAVRPLQGMARSADADLAGRIKNHLETNFDNKMLSLETIAETFGFSVGHLSRIFREQTGMTPASYIQDLRIREACRLLRFSGMPVKNIVARIGYMDHSSFSRSFKSRMGISPQEYRNSPRPAKE